MRKVKNRPILPALITEGNIGEPELFQNEVLRPVIKMQHDLLLAIFHHAIPVNREDFEKLPTLEKSKILNSLFSQNQNWKTLLLGVIIGQFSNAEFEKYSANKKDFTKRLLQICKERIASVVLK